jgi:acetoin utilization deacetylase AcuC-like enzyme/GNAT superfamily N-acetyltransferase
MFHIGRIFDVSTPAEKRRVEEVQRIFRQEFAGAIEYAERIPSLITSIERNFEYIVLTAEEGRDEVLGFALLHYYPDLHYGYLDFIASDSSRRTSGIGGALYEAVREYLNHKSAKGLFMEVPPDDPALVANPASLPVNQQRLKFYEHYGAFPIIGTRYEMLSPGSEPYDPPHLLFDPLGKTRALSQLDARRVVKAILVRKYAWAASHPYVKSVVASFASDPVQIRAPKYLPRPSAAQPGHGRLRPLKVVVAEHHEIHHVRERDYVERPARVDAILKGLSALAVERRTPRHVDDKPIRAVHDADFVNYLTAACKKLDPKATIYPYVFPIRHPDRKPRDRAVRCGYYCIDTFTPLSLAAYTAARAAVDCAVSGADWILDGEHLVYALCRPPGHHAERRVYGGFCYFSNAAIAAQRLAEKGKVALLDIDYHHGNGSQDIFYKRDDVLTISLHGHPNHSYPYFSGFADERGEGAGLNFNLNYPLPEGVDDAHYLRVLASATAAIRAFKPMYLVVSLGFDIMRGDPTGSFVLTTKGMHRIGEELASLDLPTLVIQEGGYSIRNLVRGSRAFFSGLCEGWFD